MKVLLVHDSHRSGSSSGDDAVFGRETALLNGAGVDLSVFNPSNDEYDTRGALHKISIVFQIPWSVSSYRAIKKIIKKEKPDIVHIHNFFPLLSPSIYYAIQSEGVPVVQTIHDYRFFCPMAFLFRGEEICNECITGSLFKSIEYGCFKGSGLKTLPVALMVKLHKVLGTFRDKIDAYICMTEFQKQLFAGAGFDEKRIFVKPHFLSRLDIKQDRGPGSYALFIGRLGEEKGISTILDAWKSLPDIPLRIVGDGPDGDRFRAAAASAGLRNAEFLGYRPHDECMELLAGARYLLFPSICYETFGLAIIEAFSASLPVVASRLGGMANLVKDMETGLLFTPGNASDLAERAGWLWNNTAECLRMGANCRREYEEKYAPEKNYEMLLNIYRQTIRRKMEAKESEIHGGSE